MNHLNELADPSPPEPPKGGTVSRITKSILAILGTTLLTFLPILIVKYTLQRVAEAQFEEHRQQDRKRDHDRIIKAAQEGNAGELTKKFLGFIKKTPESISKAATSPKTTSRLSK